MSKIWRKIWKIKSVTIWNDGLGISKKNVWILVFSPTINLTIGYIGNKS
jgi:hypothetical protein